MAELVVRCGNCDSLSRVPGTALGQSALCPNCGDSFPVSAAVAAIARQAATEPPTVYPVGHAHRTEPGTGLLYGLALSTFLMPLAWLLLTKLGARPPVFTLGLPLAIAFGTAGLGVGVALADRWRFATRVKGLCVLVGFAWACGTLFYFTKSEWVESIRRDFGFATGPWQTVLPSDPKDRTYKIEMPGSPRLTNVDIIDGWSFEGFRFADRKESSSAFVVAHGRPKAAAVDEDKFFEDVKAAALASCNGTLQNERKLAQQSYPGREYVIKLADNATNRMVRVFKVESKVVVAMVEGAFLPPDARDVKRFFDSLVLTPKRR